MGKYSRQDNPDIIRHIKDDSQHLRVTTGINMLPTATQYQTLVKGASLWESTSILETHVDGAFIKASSGDTLFKLRDINDVYSAYHYKYDTDNAYVIKNEADVDFSDIALHCHFNTDYSDSSSYNHIPTNNSASISSTSKFGAGSLAVSGSNQYVTFPDHTMFALGTNSWTISMQLRAEDGLKAHAHIITHGPGSTGLGQMWGIEFATNLLYFTSSAGQFHCSWTPTLNVFYHVEVSYNSSTDTCYIFIDGVSQEVTVDSAMGNIPAISYTLAIGAAWHDLIGWILYGWDGKIDEVYFVNGRCLHTTDFDAPIYEYADASTSGNTEIIRAEKSSDNYTQDLYIGSEGMRIIFLGDILVSGGGSISLRHSDLTNLGYADSGHTGFEPTISVLTMAKGGTAKNLTASNGGIVYTDADSMEILSGTATAQKLLMSQSNVAPIWSTPTYPNSATLNRILRGDGTNVVLSTFTIPDTMAINTILYASSANVLSALSTANNSILVTSSGGVPSLSTTIPTAVQNNIVHNNLSILEGGGSSSNAYRYYKLDITAVNSGSAYIGQIQFYNGGSLISPSNMTADNAPSPYVVTSNNSWEGDANWRKWKAFDSYIGSSPAGHMGWVMAGAAGYIIIDLGASYNINKYRIYSTNHNYCPRAWTLQGSNTGAFTGEQVTLDTHVNIANWGADAYVEYTFFTAGYYHAPSPGVDGTFLRSDGIFWSASGIKVADIPIMTSAEFATKISDETGTDKVVFNTSPTFAILINAPDIYPLADNTHYLGKNDDDSPLAWKGIILKDTTNGKYYRIEVINGTITPTDLTD